MNLKSLPLLLELHTNIWVINALHPATEEEKYLLKCNTLCVYVCQCAYTHS